MADLFSSTTNYDESGKGKGGGEAELQEFLAVEKQKAQFNAQVRLGLGLGLGPQISSTIKFPFIDSLEINQDFPHTIDPPKVCSQESLIFNL